MLGEEGVKKYLRRAIAKYIDEFKCGKLWLKGGFKFIAPDLIAMMQHIGGGLSGRWRILLPWNRRGIQR